MRFSTTAGALRDALATARHAVPSNASTIAHSGVQFTLKNRQLAVVGSDDEVTISAMLEVTDGEDGQVLMLPKPLASYLQKLAANTPIQVVEGPVDVEVSAGGHAPYRFRPVAATFPAPIPNRAVATAVRLDRLSGALSAVRASVHKDNPGVQLISDAEGLYLNTTDNYRVSQSRLPEARAGDFTVVVPLAVLDRVASSGITHVAVDPKGRSLKFSGPHAVITTRLMATTFPVVESVLDDVPDARVSFSTDELRQALSRLSSVAEGEPLRCTIVQDTLLLSVKNVDLGSGDEIVALQSAVSTRFEFAVKLDYLADAVQGHAGETVTLAYSAPDKPLFMLSSDPIPVKSVVMPMKVS